MERSLWRHREFMVLWAGQAVSAVGSRVSAVALPLLVLARTHSPAEAGLVGFAGSAPYALAQLPAGTVVDRWDRRRTMIVCETLRAAGLASLAAAVWLGALTLVQMLVVAFCTGCAFVVFSTAEKACLPSVVPARLLPDAIARNEAVARGGNLAGSPLGGLLLGLAPALPFAADALSYAASILSLVLIQIPHRPRLTSGRPGQELWEGMRWLAAQPFLRTFIVVVAGSNLLFQALSLALIVLARAEGATAVMTGVVLGGFGAGGIVGAVAAPWLQARLEARLVVLGGLWYWAVLLALVALLRFPWVLAVLAALAAFAGPVWNVVLGSWSLLLTPEQLRGRMLGAAGLLSWGAIPLGSLSGGFILQAVGPVSAAWSLAGGMLVLALAATAIPSVRRAARLDS